MIRLNYPQRLGSGTAQGERGHMKDITVSVLEAALVDIAVEGWRFGRLSARLLAKLDASESLRYSNQLRYYLKRTEEALALAKLHIVDVEGHPYDAGMAATAINVADFPDSDALIVDQVVEPIIMSPDGVRRSGTVMLRKAVA